MIENINDYLILTACFFLLFLVATFLVDRYRIQIQSFFSKHSWLSTKIPWNKVIKIGFAWVGILLLRKLIYYVPLPGIIQTKFSLWWGEKTVLIVIYCVSMGILFRQLLHRFIRKARKSSSEANANQMRIFIVSIFLIIFILLIQQGFTLEGIFLTIISAPFIVLKIVCPGKYIGLFTSLVLAYFIIENHKIIRKKIINPGKPGKKFILTSLFIMVALGVYMFFTFPGDWQERFQQKARAAASKRAVEDLFDAIDTIVLERERFNALGVIVVKIADTGDRQWQREAFSKVIAAAEKMEVRKWKFQLQKEIAFAAAKTGDIQWAEAVADCIPDKENKKQILKEIQKR